MCPLRESKIMHETEAEAKQLEQKGISLLRESSAAHKQCSSLAQESTRLNNEAVRLFDEAKEAGYKTRKGANLTEEARRFHEEGHKLSGEANKLKEEGSRLFEEGKKLLDESKRLKSNAETSDLSVNYVTCRCQHCDTGIEFDASQLAEDNSIVPCPHCGHETKLVIPPKPAESLADELRKLADLKAQGLLSEQEFDAAKRKLLS